MSNELGLKSGILSCMHSDGLVVAVASRPPFVEPKGSKKEEYFGLETKATPGQS